LRHLHCRQAKPNCQNQKSAPAPSSHMRLHRRLSGRRLPTSRCICNRTHGYAHAPLDGQQHTGTGTVRNAAFFHSLFFCGARASSSSPTRKTTLGRFGQQRGAFARAGWVCGLFCAVFAGFFCGVCSSVSITPWSRPPAALGSFASLPESKHLSHGGR
jgi:hypothetical protein